VLGVDGSREGYGCFNDQPGRANNIVVGENRTRQGCGRPLAIDVLAANSYSLGCGCLSLENCTLYNRRDHAASAGARRRLLGDTPVKA